MFDVKHQWICFNEFYKLMEWFFQISCKFVFGLMAEHRKKFKRIARREYWSKCNVLYINGFVLTSSTNKWKAFFKFVFELLAENRKIFNKWQGWVHASEVGRHLCWSARVPSNILFLENFPNCGTYGKKKKHMMINMKQKRYQINIQ